jgi:hypothetical protein
MLWCTLQQDNDTSDEEPRVCARSDEEEDVPTPRKRIRMETVSRAARDLYEQFEFPRKKCPKIVRFVKSYSAPFPVEFPSKTGHYYVCVPLPTDQAKDVDQRFVTSDVYKQYRLVMVDCGTSVENRDARSAYLSSHSRDHDFIDRLNQILRKLNF